MIATTEEQRLLEKWQKKLCLQEWRIKLVTHLRPEEMSVSNATGCTDWSESIKTARIEIINPACYNMNVTDVARAIFAHRNTVLYHLNKVKQQTGLDPRRFYDLVELVKIAQEVLENGS